MTFEWEYESRIKTLEYALIKTQARLRKLENTLLNMYEDPATSDTQQDIILNVLKSEGDD